MRFACLALSFFLITGCGASQDDLRIYAGPNIYSDGHEPIQLHAKLLGDSKLKAYSYKWSITKKPESSKATIENEDSLTGTLIPDQAGDYEVKLSLSKFGYTFEEDTAAITIADSYSSSKNGEVYASAELQEAIDKLGSHTEILLNPLSTYLIDSEINLRDFHNIRINGRGATLKRADSKFTTVT
ncbi:MAG: hypothetical protein RR068_08650, partial [Hafnia sp.]